MTHSIEWKIILLKKRINPDFCMNEISFDKIKKDEEVTFIYTFPRPEETLNWFYALLIFDKNKKWDYYTFELDYRSSTIFKE